VAGAGPAVEEGGRLRTLRGRRGQCQAATAARRAPQLRRRADGRGRGTLRARVDRAGGRSAGRQGRQGPQDGIETRREGRVGHGEERGTGGGGGRRSRGRGPQARVCARRDRAGSAGAEAEVPGEAEMSREVLLLVDALAREKNVAREVGVGALADAVAAGPEHGSKGERD